MDKISLQAESRTVLGKKVKVMRREGRVPAVIHERGKDSIHISALAADLTKVWREAGKNHIVDLLVDGKSKAVMFKDVSRDPARGTINHAALYAIKQNEAVTTEVPVKIVGELPAEKASWYVSHQLDMVEVKALPSDLPEVLEVDGSTLINVGDLLKVSDIKLSANVEILTDTGRVIAVVEDPAVKAAQAEAEAAANAEASATEVPSDNGGIEATEAPADNDKKSE
jgi:large subunit ribosomal protein L25